MKNHITKVIEKGEREFEERFSSQKYTTTMDSDEFDFIVNEEIKSHLRQSQLALLKAVVEGMPEEKEKLNYDSDERGFNDCLSQIISSLTTIIKELEEKR